MLTAKNEYYRHLALYYKNKAKLKRCVAAVHLEADVDKIFWQKIFQHILPGYSFDYITYSRTVDGKKATGCTTCLKYYHLGCLSDKFFVCIDSDYRYLMQEDGIGINRFIFQTYTYSLENHYCHPGNIERVFRKLGLDNRLLNFDSFLKNYSRTLYELFLYHLISRLRNDSIFTQKDFTRYMTFNGMERLNEEKILSVLKKHAEARLTTLRNDYPGVNIGHARQKFERLGLREDNAYLYFRGHNMMEQVVVKLMEEVRNTIDLNRTGSYTSMEKERHYSSRVSLIGCLMDDLNFGEYPEIKKIENDVKKFFKKTTN